MVSDKNGLFTGPVAFKPFEFSVKGFLRNSDTGFNTNGHSADLIKAPVVCAIVMCRHDMYSYACLIGQDAIISYRL